jgi:uncharacterized protein (TIGR02996 family)
MTAPRWPRLKRVDVAGFHVEVLPVPTGTGPVTIGRGAAATLRVPSDRISRLHCQLREEHGGWQIEDLGSSGGTWLNARRVDGSVRLSHGDRVWLGDTRLVFLDQPELESPELEAVVTQHPDDPSAVRVWADWLLERGDPFGEHLLSPHPVDFALEGLAPLVRAGQLELDWQHGLIRTARLRCVEDATYWNVEVLARLVALRAARWLDHLTVDLTTWVDPSAAQHQRDAALVLRGLAQGPRLSTLSLGYVTEALPDSPFLEALYARLTARHPPLRLAGALPWREARRAWLRVERVPAGLDFHHAGSAQARIPLEDGVWVGAASEGTLRAVAPGVPRQGVRQRFLVRQEAPRWCLVPLDGEVTINGHPAAPTRLLPGDLLEVPPGVQLRFEVDEGATRSAPGLARL